MLIAILIFAAQLAACTLQVSLTRDTGVHGLELNRRPGLKASGEYGHGPGPSRRNWRGQRELERRSWLGPYGLQKQQAPDLHRRHGLVDLVAVNNIHAGGYYAEMGVGTPPQRISFLVDTGSSDTWVNSVDADLCRDAELQRRLDLWCEPAFNPNKSSSLQTIDPSGFSITYLDRRTIHGDYIADTLSIAHHSLSLQLGLALHSTRPTGIMGLGLRANLASRTPYPTLLDVLVSHGIIATPVFSLCLGDLDAKSGSLLFGGIDPQKYIARLVSLPMVPDTYLDASSASSSSFPSSSSASIRSYAVRLHTLDIPDIRLPPLNARAILDSGSTISLLPSRHTHLIHTHFSVHSLPNITTPLVDCALRNSPAPFFFTFTFSPPTTTSSSSPPATIRVPISNIITDTIPLEIQASLRPALPSSWRAICVFAIASAEEFAVNEPDFVLLGDSFLRSAYVVYDLANRQLALAQANLRPRGSNVIALEANATSLPNVLGVDESINASCPDSRLLVFVGALAMVLLVTTFLPA